MTHKSSAAADGSQKPRAIVLAVAVPAHTSVAPDSVCALSTRTTLPKFVRLRRMSCCLQTLRDVVVCAGAVCWSRRRAAASLCTIAFALDRQLLYAQKAHEQRPQALIFHMARLCKHVEMVPGT